MNKMSHSVTLSEIMGIDRFAGGAVSLQHSVQMLRALGGNHGPAPCSTKLSNVKETDLIVQEQINRRFVGAVHNGAGGAALFRTAPAQCRGTERSPESGRWKVKLRAGEQVKLLWLRPWCGAGQVRAYWMGRRISAEPICARIALSQYSTSE